MLVSTRAGGLSRRVTTPGAEENERRDGEAVAYGSTDDAPGVNRMSG